MWLSTLQTAVSPSFDANLEKLLSLYHQSKASLVLAPEVAITGFCYNRFEEAAAFGKMAKEQFLRHIGSGAFGVTLIEKEEQHFVNTFYLFSQGKIIHRQRKHHLFLLGEEDRYFTPGEAREIQPFLWNGLKVGVLICFELRFPKLWEQLRGCDLILVPAQWGKPRKAHLHKLSEALAITNQTTVLVSDGASPEMARGSAVITPWGDSFRDDRKQLIECSVELLREQKRVRRAIPLGF